MIEKHGDFETKVKRDQNGMLVMQLPNRSNWQTYDGRCGSCEQFPTVMQTPQIFPVFE